MEDPASDIHDWEVILQDGEDGKFITKSSSSSSSIASAATDEGGVIQSDYFTLDSHHQHKHHDYDYVGGGDTAPTSAEEDSDNPSWVDPSGSSVVGGAGRKRSRSPNSYSSSSESSTVDQHHLLSLIHPHSQSGCGCGAHEDFNIPNELGMAEEFHDAVEAGEGQQQKLPGAVVVAAVGDEVSGEMERERERDTQEKEEKKRVVWWKVPVEVLRYCLMKVGPVWSLSMAAAAVMGLVILRRRYLYKLKRKAQGIQLKVTVDDKKVSQFMTRAARLNEAFSVVKRVPIMRPALPAPGMVPWPVVSMR